MRINDTSLQFEALPQVYPLLNSIEFMWFIVIVTIAIISWIAAKLWQIHSIPKHLAKEKGLAQAKLIFWLCILGLAWKPLWFLAALAIVTDWDKVQTWIKGTR
ncbi:Mg2+ and Co2+ transporter [Shewanella sp. UCD-KL12]|uniref:Mg2+ and Co2+ transporter n=1 Tax=Shewanella sp. UCD-KL12 TaxID=1917163 RepID=UPI000970FC9F|nr:Mg2+ and Co2+ transporter [Shewanella sp. UCD-KL12]